MKTNIKVASPWHQITEAVESARREWLFALSYFDHVTDEDLVEYATYMIKATEKRYIYLLKQARRQGITYSPFWRAQDG